MIKPLRDYIVVEPVVRKLSNILWTDNRENYCNGRIVAIGNKVTEAKVGDFIVYGGEEYLNWKVIDDEGERYQIISEKDICCIVDGE